MATKNNSKNNLRRIITAALPYANGEIHLGHIASTYLPADIFARFSRQRGYFVVFSCGTDDYGVPIQIKAEQEGVHPREYASFWRSRDREDFESLGISFDIFLGTDIEENRKLAQEFFTTLREKGYIYEKNVLQYYCPKEDRFLPDRYVVGTCPYCGAQNQYGDLCEVCGHSLNVGDLLNPKCAVCGADATLKESNHFVFALSKFSEPLKKWLIENEKLQQEVKNYVLKWIEEGLRDWDITRDITWGVPVPGREGKQSLYGWFENHLGYISITLKYLKEKLNIEDGVSFWNSSEVIHFIGKDIVYHHYLFLPAERIAEGRFKLPDQIPTRGYLLLQNRKLSKSKGWYISLREFLNNFPPDYLRYYLTAITPYSQADINFDWAQFAEKINNELISIIGNLFVRVTKFLEDRYACKVPEPGVLKQEDFQVAQELQELIKKYSELLERNEFSEALKVCVNFAHKVNQFFQYNEPWKNKELADKTLYLSVNYLRSLIILLYPFIPFSSEKMWNLLDLREDLAFNIFHSANNFEAIKPGHRIKKSEIIFERIPKEKIDELIKNLA
ncbi:MAG: methionine--tRNA ligase [Thermoproteota archaeon]|jgi:methionyl-tRNA synthetase